MVSGPIGRAAGCVTPRMESWLEICGGPDFVGVKLAGASSTGVRAFAGLFRAETLLLLPGSRSRPSRNAAPSRRQFLAIAENCSRCHRMMRRDPMLNGRWTRTQAPDGEVSSSVAGVRKDVPLSSSHATSATAHITLRGSIARSSMPTVSAARQGSLVTSEYRDHPSLKLPVTDEHEVVKKTVILMAPFFWRRRTHAILPTAFVQAVLHRSSGLQKNAGHQDDKRRG